MLCFGALVVLMISKLKQDPQSSAALFFHFVLQKRELAINCIKTNDPICCPPMLDLWCLRKCLEQISGLKPLFTLHENS